MRQYFHSVLRHHIRMLPLCAWQFVLTYNLPSVWVVLIHEHTPRPHVDHGLDGECHTRNQQHACSLVPIMLYIRFLMKPTPHSMPAQVADNAIAVGMCMLGNGIAKVTNEHIRLATYLFANFQTFPCNVYETLTSRVCLSNDKHTAGIGKVSIQDSRTIHVHDITFSQDILFLGNTMTDNLVYTGTATLGVSLVVQRSWNAAMLHGEVIHYLVNLQSSHPFANLLGNSIQHRCVQHSGTPDTLNLFLRLYQIATGAQLTTFLKLHNPAIHLRRRQSWNQLPIITTFLSTHLIIYLHVGKVTLFCTQFLPVWQLICIFAHNMQQSDTTKNESNVLTMLLIFILAGAFSMTANRMGCVDSIVNLSMILLPDDLILAGLFTASCIVSISIGTSCGTIAALTPIAAGIAQHDGLSLPLLTATIVGGSLFGDNLSFISDTTIMATRTQRCRQKDKFLSNIRIALPAAIATVILYCILGNDIHRTSVIHGIHALHILPYAAIFILALSGLNVILVLLAGIVCSSVIALSQGSLTPNGIWTAMWDGTQSMHDLIIFTICAAVIIQGLTNHGIIEKTVNTICRHIRSPRAAEASISAAVIAVDMLTANNTIAIMAVGPVARHIAQRFHIAPQRTASLLDTMSCFAQGIIPWGAQMLIAAGLAGISPIDILPYLYYPLILGILTSIGIIVKKS